jgi:molybdate transport system substrate-binding protein
MRKMAAIIALLLCSLASAQAAELKVMTVGLVGSSFLKLVDAWSKKTGNTVALPIGPSALGLVLEAMKTKEIDVVLLPMSEMPAQAGQFRPGTVSPIGYVPFGLGGKVAGPRIATEAEFQAALAGKTVLVSDPATSLNGRMATAVLARPGYESVKVRPIASSASNLPRSDADYVLTVLPEVLAVPELKLLGLAPAELGLRIDFGGGIFVRAQNVALARDFLAFLASSEAQAVWKAGGVVPAN